MSPHASRRLRNLHVAAILAIGMVIAGIMLGQVRLSLAATVAVLFIVIISLEALRVAQGKSEKH